MAQVTNFFLGANSGSGFQNLFSEILDVNDTFDLMILKGGPGVGKNTFMREIGRTMEAARGGCGIPMVLGDPDSLDGVVIPSIRCGVCDGTSPHVMDGSFRRQWTAMWIWAAFMISPPPRRRQRR